jgi:hypothetical protein
VKQHYDEEKRVRIRFTEAMSDNLDFLTSRGLPTTAAIKEALSLYAFAVRNRNGGRKLVSMNPDGSDVVEIM